MCYRALLILWPVVDGMGNAIAAECTLRPLDRTCD
eukprot:COSAG03_NODE_25196_length_267_cov_0.619048_1_plen_34_part_01